MVELDDLISEVKNLKNSLNEAPEEEPSIELEIPGKKWYHISDALTRQDELLASILKAIQALKYPGITAPPAVPMPPPTPPVVPGPSPVFPPGIPEKMDSLILEQTETKTLLEGFKFKTNQTTIVTTGAAQQAIHQFRTYFIIVRADTDNTADVGIGPKGVTPGTAYNIGAGESVGMTIDVLKSALYVVGTTGDSISWVALV